ncbi:hypothetical protein [Pseudoalteromonas sp.]|jgi:hypothetical protein|uniref:hypothetical protein n=1 Tax=Pseudoalteromonas sp. TaxID=53249 RepID=UPI00356608D6
MTTIFLSHSQQAALQQALISNKLLNSYSLKCDNAPSAEQQTYSLIAVMLYRFKKQKITWSSFLTTATNAANSVCPWLASELVRCQQTYQAQPNDSVISQQSAFISGIFSEELAYIDALLESDVQGAV